MRKQQPPWGAAAPRARRIDPATFPALSFDDLPGDVHPEDLYEILKVNTGMMRLLQARDPQMYAAAQQPTVVALRSLLIARNFERALPEANRVAKLAQLEARLARNPYDVEAQKLMEQEIERKNVEQNFEHAYEHNPELFGSVHMLYVDAKVNGHHIKIFVDSGAQTTIMSKSAAQRCGIMRLVDTKYAGTAVGVGSAPIIGRVHMAQLEMAGQNFPSSFTVLDQDNNECLLGLDMLKRYQSCIDLRANVLRLHLGSSSVEVPFLGEGDVPSNSFGMSGGSSSGSAGSGPSDSAASGGAGSSSSVAAPPSPMPSSGAGASASSSSASSSAAAASRGAAPAHPPSSESSLMETIDLTMFGDDGAAAAGAAPPRAAPAAGGGSGSNEGALRLLLGMGFSRAKAEQALLMAEGNVDLAASLLPDL